MTLAHRVEYAGLRGLIGVSRALPRRMALAMADGIGDLLHDAVRVRRSVVEDNLRRAFPEKGDAERGAIARACYRAFSRTAIEFARLQDMSPDAILRMGTIEGREHIEAIARGGRGAILLSGHFGNWEWAGATFAALGHEVDVVVGEQHNKPVGDLIDSMRRRVGVGVLNAEHDLRGILESLRKRHFVAIVADQDAGRDGIFVDFFGRPASTTLGPVRLARRFQVPILLGFDFRDGRGGHRLELHPPMFVSEEGEEEAALRRGTEAWVRALEEAVRRAPENWFWMHRRWKTRPKTGA